DHEMGAYLIPGSTASLNVDWQDYNYQGGAGFDPQYIIEASLFQYDDWNFENDLAIADVISPSMKDRAAELNPICNNPQVVVTNSGSEFITSAKFRFWVEGSPDVINYKWTGLLRPGQSETIELPSYDRWLFGGKTKNVFHVEIRGVNNGEDEYDQNNHFKTLFADTEVFPADFVLAFDNNFAANETRYVIKDDRGDVLYSRNQVAANANHYDTIRLDTGCYTLNIIDSDCDGLNFFANNDGSGKIWLHPADGSFFPPFHQFTPGFGCEANVAFTVGYELGAEETKGYPEGMRRLYDGGDLVAYPNPANDQITLALVGDLDASGGLSIYNQTGQLVRQLGFNGGQSMVVSGLSAGHYFAQYRSENHVKTVKFVILR
ncbi:MAG: T9SS type A sorting domain-containing protein, partial [Salibacteraceae bacterium]